MVMSLWPRFWPILCSLEGKCLRCQNWEDKMSEGKVPEGNFA